MGLQLSRVQGACKSKRDRQVSVVKGWGRDSGFQLFYPLQYGIKKLLNILLFNAGKGYAEIALSQGNEPHAILV